MKSKALLILVALVAMVVLAAATAMAGAAIPTGGDVAAAQPAAGGAEPDRLTGGITPGVYAARDWRGLPTDTFPITGGHQQFTWRDIETANNVYDWSAVDTWLAMQSAQGKAAGLGFVTYNGRLAGGLQAPDWFVSAQPAAFITCSGGQKIPRYWNSEYQTYYRRFLQAAASRYNGDARLNWVQIGVGLYGENQPADDDGIAGVNDTTCVKTALAADLGIPVGNTGALSDNWSYAARQITAMHAAVWTKPLFEQYSPSFIRRCERLDTTNYAASMVTSTIGLFAAGLMPDQDDAVNSEGQTGCGKFDPIFTWNQSATRTVPIAFESYQYMLPDTTALYWGVLSALNKHTDILNLNPDLLINNDDRNQPKTENFPALQFANRYLGKTITNTPDIWVALRETDPAHTVTNPVGLQYGNYSFWLTQDDTVAGGRTVTATTSAASSRYDAILTGSQGWSTRRTDHATGNDYMYFNVDNSFISAQSITSAVLITVTYLDTGSDAWLLYYKNAAGTEFNRGVTKTNTGQWKTASFTIMDMSFSGQYTNGNDLRIYNAAVGDEYIHMVAIGKYRPAGPAPTATGTRTATATATAVPTTVVFQQGISPSASYAGVKDTYISNFGDTTSNYGSASFIALRNSDQRAGLIKFDVSSIPGYAIIDSATVGFYVEYQSNANSLPIELHKVRRAWVEDEATWLNASAANAWGTAGANNTSTDIFAGVVASTTLTNSGYWHEFNVTSAVSDWVQNAGANNGLAIKTGSVGSVEYHLRSSDYNTPASYRPMLTVVYHLPGGPTPTPTNTGTPTRTPTRTPTQTPVPQTVVFQRGVAPFGSYTGVADTFISNFDDTTTNYGISPTLELRSNDVRSALLRFDISSLPATANIVQAQVSVHVDYKTNPFTLPVSLYKVTRSWNEMSATWLLASTGAPWGVPGANAGSDHSTTATSSLVMSSADQWYDFDVTNLVKQWFATPSDNKGVILKASTGPSVAYGLRSSEYFSNPAYRPKLTIQCYNCQPQGGYRIMLPVIVSVFTATP